MMLLLLIAIGAGAGYIAHEYLRVRVSLPVAIGAGVLGAIVGGFLLSMAMKLIGAVLGGLLVAGVMIWLAQSFGSRP
ncbi:MAG: hypothetical protein MRY63_13055 [Neomegalonema sp.]|nr:hypothetical protein [Neomegalonema sp.]